jgi:hypothetical protein
MTKLRWAYATAFALTSTAALAQGAPPAGGAPVGAGGAGMVAYNSDPLDAADAATVLAWAND